MMKKVIYPSVIAFLAILSFAFGGKKTTINSNKQEADSSFVKLADMSKDFAYDMRYATSNNFLKQQVYDCADCIVRKAVALSLIEANKEFMQKGYRIKFFDCYRPLDVQKKMWEVFPDSRYVANPANGSIHNRGGAVDITLVDMNGKELDMGTGFDFFGEKAHHDFTDLPQEVLDNRTLLKTIMEKHGFSAIRTEWWHYNFGTAKKYQVSNFKVECSN